MISPMFTYSHSMRDGFHMIECSLDKNHVGFIMWDGDDDGRVQDLYVKPEFRRQHAATGMWNEAVVYCKQNFIQQPTHSETRTLLGDLWAQTMPNYFETEGIIEPYTD